MINEDIIKEDFIINFKKNLYTQKLNKDFSEYVFLCVGTDKVVGDSIGPIVGSMLKKYFKENNVLNTNVYGSLDFNVNYINIKNVIDLILKKHPNSCIIVIDAALSNIEENGYIFVSSNKIILGKALNKENVEVGDISIKIVVGNVSKGVLNNFKNLRKCF